MWAVMTFFYLTSEQQLRERLFGAELAATPAVETLCLVFPFMFAFFVAYSRLYEGLHYPSDVLVGAVLGVGSAIAYANFLPHIWENDPKTYAGRALLLSTLPVAFLALLVLSYRSRVEPNEKDLREWTRTAARGKYKGKSLQPHLIPFGGYVGMAGVCGLNRYSSSVCASVRVSWQKQSRQLIQSRPVSSSLVQFVLFII